MSPSDRDVSGVGSAHSWHTSAIRLIVPYLICLALLTTAVFAIFLPSVEQKLLDEKRMIIRQLTESMVHALETLHQQEKAGLLTRPQAQAKAKEHIRTFRYGPDGKDYFWANNMQCHMVVHPYTPELDGTDMTDYRDRRGKYIVREFIKIIKKSGSGYVDYMWQWKDDPSREVPKLSYVTQFEPWEWIVGTGIYIEDVRAEIASLTRKVLVVFLVVLGVMILSGVYLLRQGLKTEKQRLLAEESLRDSQRRYRALVEEQVEAVCRWTPNMTLTFVNKSYCRLFGKPREKLLGQKWLELIPPDSRQDVQKYYKELAKNPKVISYEHTVTAADGTKRWYHWTDCPIMNEQGQIEEFQSVGRDSTDRKQAEAEHRELGEKMQHMQKLESLGVLAGGIAHDFNNLLVAILGNADLALREMNEMAPARKHVDEIKQASVRAAELTNQMLAYSGKGRFIVKVFDLTELVREMAFLLEVSISKKIVLKYDFADNLPPVEADAAQIRQVVMNLITNASEAIGDNSGVITISTGTMTVDENYLNGTYLNEKLPEGYYTYVEVSDTGCGIDQEVRAKLFDPFFSTKFTGRGLGLAAVIGIVRGHRGAIKVYSEPSRGSTFKVMLPASAKKTDTLKKTDASSKDPWRGSGTIMVVDDEESVRNVTKIMLEECGFTVLTACDGREAIDIFKERSEEINLVLLDMTMPRMDGRDAFREMKLIRDDVKVILSSGYNEQEATSRFTGKGLAGFIQKPYPMKKLIKSIRRALGTT